MPVDRGAPDTGYLGHSEMGNGIPTIGEQQHRPGPKEAGPGPGDAGINLVNHLPKLRDMLPHRRLWGIMSHNWRRVDEDSSCSEQQERPVDMS